MAGKFRTAVAKAQRAVSRAIRGQPQRSWNPRGEIALRDGGQSWLSQARGVSRGFPLHHGGWIVVTDPVYAARRGWSSPVTYLAPDGPNGHEMGYSMGYVGSDRDGYCYFEDADGLQARTRGRVVEVAMNSGRWGSIAERPDEFEALVNHQQAQVGPSVAHGYAMLRNIRDTGPADWELDESKAVYGAVGA